MERIKRELTEGERIGVLIILALLMLSPFLNKAIHTDDTVRSYHARQILGSPLHPMDFDLH